MTHPTCIFCTPDREILAESTHALAFADAFPVSPGHTLVVPRRHVATIFDLPEDEYADCFLLALKVKGRRAVRVARAHPCDPQVRGGYAPSARRREECDSAEGAVLGLGCADYAPS